MKRVVGSYTLSQLELSTLLCEIEACLNSRPIAPLRDDPNNYDTLIPGHYLIGRPLLSVPEPSLLDVNANRLSRWQKSTLCANTFGRLGLVIICIRYNSAPSGKVRRVQSKSEP